MQRLSQTLFIGSLELFRCMVARGIHLLDMVFKCWGYVTVVENKRDLAKQLWIAREDVTCRQYTGETPVILAVEYHSRFYVIVGSAPLTLGNMREMIRNVLTGTEHSVHTE